MKKMLSENSRKITVLQVNEKSLIRQYTTLVEMERQLRKENEKQKNELISMEAEVSEKIGRLQRFKVYLVFLVWKFLNMKKKGHCNEHLSPGLIVNM